MNTILKLASAIITGFLFLRIGFEAESDKLSIIVQSLGYLFLLYPFILFVKVFVNQVVYAIKQKKDKK